MAEGSMKQAMHIPEAKSAFSKLFEFAVGPGLMLAVLVVLGTYLIINDQGDEPRVYAAHQQLAGR